MRGPYTGPPRDFSHAHRWGMTGLHKGHRGGQWRASFACFICGHAMVFNLPCEYLRPTRGE